MKLTSTVVLIDQAGLVAILVLAAAALVLLVLILRHLGDLHDTVQALDDPIPEAEPPPRALLPAPPSKPFPIEVIVHADPQTAATETDLGPVSAPRRGIETSPTTRPLRVNTLLARLNAEQGQVV